MKFKRIGLWAVLSMVASIFSVANSSYGQQLFLSGNIESVVSDKLAGDLSGVWQEIGDQEALQISTGNDEAGKSVQFLLPTQFIRRTTTGVVIGMVSWHEDGECFTLENTPYKVLKVGACCLLCEESENDLVKVVLSFAFREGQILSFTPVDVSRLKEIENAIVKDNEVIIDIEILEKTLVDRETAQHFFSGIDLKLKKSLNVPLRPHSVFEVDDK